MNAEVKVPDLSDSEDSENERVVVKQSPFIRIDVESNTVSLTSPTFGDSISIKNPTVKFGTSVNAMKDLTHVET